MAETPHDMLPRFRRTRIAPTPSGFLHLGNVLSFSLTAYLAEICGARIMLRIDDMDAPRVRPGYVRDIFETLRFLDIPWDEGPRDYDDYGSGYSQLLRMEMYQAALGRLRERGAVYACSCSRASYHPGHGCPAGHIPLDTPGVSWRLFTPRAPWPAGPLPASMKDFVVRRKDGMPAYQLSSVIDDDYFGVDLVVRGEDLADSTLAQRYLSGVLEGNSFLRAACLHHPLLTAAPGGEKLSKSAGATSVRYLRQAGLTPAQIFGRTAAMAGCAPAGDYLSLGAAVAGGGLLHTLSAGV